MTPKEKDGTDVDAVQISSSKELDAEVAGFLTAFRDKETEYNWEARDRSLTRLRGILRGNAAEKYHDAFMLAVRQMVDGIIKAVESLRTSLALNALNVVAEIGIYLGKSIDAYIYDRLLDCLFKCASTTKKVIASASLKATITFISHATYHHKLMNMLGMMMNEKNNQVRLFTLTYTKTVLQAHAHRDHTRAVLDRTGGTDILVKILEKGLSDATPAVRENCRDAFWIFHEHWRDRGENLLRSLQPTIRKAVEKSKAKAIQNHRSIHSPTNSSSSLHTSSSLGSHRNISDIHDALSPSTSTASNGSTGSSEPHPTPDIRKTMTRSVSPRASSPSIRSTSPHLLRSFGSPPPNSWQLHSSHAVPSSPPPSASSRKTRVPTLSRKKSTISTKRKLSLFSMLSHDDLSLRCDGLHMLARKLSDRPYSAQPDLQSIQLESTHGVLDGEKLRTTVWNMLQEDNARLYEALSSWDAVAGVLVKLLTFEELMPKLILDATADAVSLRTDDDITRHEAAISAFKRVKAYLKRYEPNLAEQLFTALIMTSAATPKRPLQSTAVSKKDPMRNPANRRKLTSKYLEWMDELVTPILGLDSSEDVADEPESKEWIGDSPDNVASQWFESDAHVRQYLEQLLPLVSTSTPGSIVHEPLISLVGHLRLVNQKLFETIAGTFDSKTMTKIGRTLGIHIRVIPDYVCQSSSPMNDESLATEHGHEEEVQRTEIAEEIVEEQHTEEYRDEPHEQVEDQEEEYEQKRQPKEEQVTSTAYSPVNDTTDTINTSEQPKPTMPIEHTTITNDDTYEHDTESPVQSVSMPEIPVAPDEPFVPESTEHAAVSPAPFDPHLDDLPIPVATPYDNRALVPPLGSSEYMSPKMRSFESNGTHENQHHRMDPVAPNSPPVPATAGLAALNTDQGITPHPPNLPSISTAAKRRVYETSVTHVPYFAPSQVSEPWPTLKQNKRSEPSMAAMNGRSARDKTSTLYALIDKLKSMNADNAVVRKLTRLAREAPVMQPWDQGGRDEPGSDLWAAAEADGGNFVEVVQSAILYLDGSQKTLSVLELVRQLASTQCGLFQYCERRIDEQGMSLEARLMERLLAVRASPDASVSTAAEDALDILIKVLDPTNVFEILLSFLAYRLCISPLSDEQVAHTSRYHPLGSAFTYLGKCVQEVRDAFFVEEWLFKAGAVVFLKGVNHPSIHVRKSCVETIVQFHGVMGDDIYQFLDELRTDQVNLVRHYVSRAIKKKAGARSLSSTPIQNVMI